MNEMKERDLTVIRYNNLRTFAPIATAHFFTHVTHTSCITVHKGKHDAKGANICQKNGT